MTMRTLLFVAAGAVLPFLTPNTVGAFQEFDPARINVSGSPPQVLEARSRAETSYQQGDYARVVELTNWLIQNYPNDNLYVALHLRASAKVELGRIAGSAKQVREGISDARKALATNGAKYPWLHIPYLYGLSSLAEIERRPEHADLAIKVVTPVLGFPLAKDYTKDDRANLYYQRGLAYAARRDYKSAAADHAEAIRLTPQHLGAHVKRPEALAAMGQPKEALAAWDDAVAKFPNEVLVFNERGKYRRIAGDLEGAVDDFTRCLSIDPKFAVGYVNRGLCLAEQNSPQAAEGEYSEALKLAPAGPQAILALRLRAAARLAQGNAAGAIADFAVAIKADPQNAALFEERGYARYFQKEFAEAVADFGKARQLNPELAHLVPWQSLAKARAGEAAEARTLLENSLSGKTPPAGWTAKVCNYLLDNAREQELFDAAREAGAQGKHLCEAHYFAGQKQLLREEAASAADHFREAVDTKAFELAAFRGARYELSDF
jgi:tetratricopeptide (TPR) repeat protein